MITRRRGTALTCPGSMETSMHDDPVHIVGVMGVVRDAEGRVLLVRGDRRGWEPPGGQVEEGESLPEALAREVLEESGCAVEVGRLVGVYSNVALPPKLMLTFLCTYLGGEAAGGDECLEAGWFPPEEALRLVTHPAQLPKLRDALAGGDGVVYRVYQTNPYQELQELQC